MSKQTVGRGNKSVLGNAPRKYWAIQEEGSNWTLTPARKDDFPGIVFDAVLDDSQPLSADINPVAQEIWSRGEHVGFATLVSLDTPRMVELISEAYPGITVEVA